MQGRLWSSAVSLTDKSCQIEIENPDRDETAFFDIQSAAPGTFLNPLLFDNVIWAPNSTKEIVWVYIKGNLIGGPSPGHPFEMPFSQMSNFTLDLVTASNTSHSVETIMPPTTSKPFWDSSAPFGSPDGVHAMGIYKLKNKTCKFNEFAAMAFYWNVSSHLETTYRLRLSTDSPEFEFLSGSFQIVDTMESVLPKAIFGVATQCYTSYYLLVPFIAIIAFCLLALRRRSEYARCRQAANGYGKLHTFAKNSSEVGVGQPALKSNV